MQVPVQVTFRGMPVSDSIEAACWAEAEKLEKYWDRLTSCRVVVTQSHRHRQGNLFEVRIGLTAPGAEIVVNREPPQHHADEDATVAIREAFDTARRRVEDHIRRKRGQVKAHETPARGRVCELDAGAGYGFIETSDGRRIYFHRNAVLDGGFDALAIGSAVRFVEEMGHEGPQASTVVPE
jgi:cold shock CspA family protein